LEVERDSDLPRSKRETEGDKEVFLIRTRGINSRAELRINLLDVQGNVCSKFSWIRDERIKDGVIDFVIGISKMKNYKLILVC
jgi:hypothetical protein